MNPLLIGPLADLVKSIIGRIWPDPAKQQEAATVLLKMQQDGELAQLDAQIKLATAQTDVNKVEAASTNLFVAGWRPFIGWCCGSGLAIQFIVGPIVSWIAALAGHPVAFPTLDMGTLLTLLLGMLGLGGMRTVEKLQGKA